MAGAEKRKGGPHGGQGGGSAKRSKGGSGNRKWTTAQHDARRAEKLERGEALAVGDQGIWVSFVRGMDLKAMREFKRVCYEYGEKMYGIKAPSEPGDKEAKDDGDDDDDDDDDDDEPGDIEASINKELESFKNKPKSTTRQVFTIVKADLECLFFVKTMEPVDPIDLVRRICQDARSCSSPGERKLRYINRLTPIVDTDRSTEAGILKVARSVMAPHFLLRTGDESAGSTDSAIAEKEDREEKENDSSHPTYAIRPSLRNFKTLRSMEVINKIAAIVRPEHKVNLSSPGKVVLVEIFQLFCGVSVVSGEEWEKLKRYNVNELYRLAFEDAGAASEPQATEKAHRGTKSED